MAPKMIVAIGGYEFRRKKGVQVRRTSRVCISLFIVTVVGLVMGKGQRLHAEGLQMLGVKLKEAVGNARPFFGKWSTKDAAAAIHRTPLPSDGLYEVLPNSIVPRIQGEYFKFNEDCLGVQAGGNCEGYDGKSQALLTGAYFSRHTAAIENHRNSWLRQTLCDDPRTAPLPFGLNPADFDPMQGPARDFRLAYFANISRDLDYNQLRPLADAKITGTRHHASSLYKRICKAISSGPMQTALLILAWPDGTPCRHMLAYQVADGQVACQGENLEGNLKVFDTKVIFVADLDPCHGADWYCPNKFALLYFEGKGFFSIEKHYCRKIGDYLSSGRFNRDESGFLPPNPQQGNRLMENQLLLVDSESVGALAETFKPVSMTGGGFGEVD